MKKYNNEKLLLPVSIVGLSVLADNTDALFKEKEKQIGLGESDLAIFHGKGRIVLDFGCEIKGGIRIIVRDGCAAGVKIRLGESITECLSELGEKNSTNDGSVRDMTVTLPSLSDNVYFNSGFRYLCIDFLGDEEVKIKNIYAVSKFYDRKSGYSYCGNDKEVEKIFSVAKRTIDLCIDEDYIWDGVKRDRLVWIGDLYPEMIAATTLYGRVEQIENSLEFVKNQTPLPGWMNDIQTYSLWWVITLAEYFKRTGCKAFAKKQLSYVGGIVKMIAEHVSEDGKLDFDGYFIDWQTGKCEDEIYGGYALHILALKAAEELFSAFGLSTEFCDDVLTRIRNVKIPDCTKKQIIGLKYWATGEISEREKNTLVEGGAKGFSTFMSWVILKAIAETVSVKTARDIMVEYYSAMLDMGATTFWEDFDTEWLENAVPLNKIPTGSEKGVHGDYGKYCYVGHRHSLCHGWSTGIIDVIKNYF